MAERDTREEGLKGGIAMPERRNFREAGLCIEAARFHVGGWLPHS